MTVIIRKQGYAYVWTCRTLVNRNGKMEPCNHSDVVESEKVAHSEYERHKKITKGH